MDEDSHLEYEYEDRNGDPSGLESAIEYDLAPWDTEWYEDLYL